MNGESKLQAGLMLIGSLGLVVFPLILLSDPLSVPAWQAQPFATTVPVNATFTPPIGTTQPLPTPIPTLGPGQYFEEDDQNRPEVGQVHGTDRFGWGRIQGKPGLVLVWVIDSEGTQYAVVDETTDLFLGTLDPVTNTRREDGIEDYIAQREELQRQRLGTAGEGIGSGVAIGVLAWGIGLCPVTGGGGCVAGVVGAAAVFVANAVRNHFILAGQNADLRELDSNLFDAFDEAVP